MRLSDSSALANAAAPLDSVPVALPTIAYSGFLGGPKSMGRVGEYLVRHLLAQGRYQVRFLPWPGDFMADYWGDEISNLIIDGKEAPMLGIDQSISFCSVRDARQEKFARRTTVWLYYELSSVPEEVVAEINSNDHVYVTSSFVHKTFSDHGVTVPMSVLGHGYDPSLYQYVPRSRGREFVFLCVAEHTSRKNLPFLVRCFEKAFQHAHDVRLVLKLGFHGEGDLRRHVSQPEKVTLLTKLFADEAKLAALYRQVHCFVLPTRGEGFGMPILEAMATGLPVITTDYGGQLDFCSAQNSFLIQNRGLVDSDPNCFPNIQSQWADPDPDHLIALMRQVYDDYEHALAVGQRGYHTVRDQWTWERQLNALTVLD